MNLKPIRTRKISPGCRDIYSVLDSHLTKFGEKSILAITSKIISICEGRVVKIGGIDKKTLTRNESDFYLPAEGKYDITLTIKDNLLIPTAGIDESNGSGHYVLWPSNPQKSANEIRKYLCRRFSLKKAGVIITDSRTTPLRTGTTGVALAHSGFLALRDYVGKPDLFGRELKVTRANVIDALAASAVLIMGEGNEQTPLALIDDLPFVEFQERNPASSELKSLKISPDDDLYAPLLNGAKWKKGRSRAGKLFK